MINYTDHHEALRVWARGMHHVEAGTELLIRTGFATPERPWVQHGPWIDHTVIADNISGMPGGDQRILRIAAMLLDSGTDSLGDHLASTERPRLELVLAAVAHAAGSRTGYTAEISDGEVRKVWVEAAYPWPDAN